jgi:hypothetical protein
MAHLKRSIIEVKAEENCLAYAPIIGIARFINDPNYKAYRQGRKICPAVDHLLATSINLTNKGGIPERMKFQEHFKEFRIIVFGGLNCDKIYFDEHVESEKRINLLYDDVSKHYYVICNLRGAMTRGYVCRGCNKWCERA